MKLRNGFVSNSSSSSFISFSMKDELIDIASYTEYNNDPLVVDGNFGETEFGWGPDIIKGWQSMIIFSYLQTRYAKNDDWLEMLENVIKKTLGVSEIIWEIALNFWDSDDDYDKNRVYGYIDHQSNANEGANTEMFIDEDTLTKFIFGKRSHIVLDNDNH